MKEVKEAKPKPKSGNLKDAKVLVCNRSFSLSLCIEPHPLLYSGPARTAKFATWKFCCKYLCVQNGRGNDTRTNQDLRGHSVDLRGGASWSIRDVFHFL